MTFVELLKYMLILHVTLLNVILTCHLWVPEFAGDQTGNGVTRIVTCQELLFLIPKMVTILIILANVIWCLKGKSLFDLNYTRKHIQHIIFEAYPNLVDLPSVLTYMYLFFKAKVIEYLKQFQQ